MSDNKQESEIGLFNKANYDIKNSSNMWVVFFTWVFKIGAITMYVQKQVSLTPHRNERIPIWNPTQWWLPGQFSPRPPIFSGQLFFNSAKREFPFSGNFPAIQIPAISFKKI
jgi:hypothetical protein